MTDHHILALAKITSNWKLYNYLNNQMIPWSRAHLGKLTVYWLVKKYPTFCGKQRFTTILTTVCQSLIQFILSLHTYLISVLILFSHLSPSVPSVLFLSVFFPPKLWCATCSAHLIFDLKMQIMVRITKHETPQDAVFSSLLLLCPFSFLRMCCALSIQF